MASVDELSKKYSSQLSQLQSIFPSWDEGDLVFTLQDAKGNLEEAAMAITEGRASQFTQATRKKPIKTAQPQGKGFSNRNADTGGWENANGGGESAGRGGRGGRGGARGARGGRGGEPFRGGRGGRGGARGGRGGFANVNGGAPGKKTNGYPTSTATTTEGWANQVEQAKAADGADESAWSTAADAASTVKDVEAGPSSSEPPVEASKADDFNAAGGLSDAPAPKEIEAAVKQSAPAPKPKLTWAQIAKPAEKPKPAPPPPAPKKEPEPPVTTVEPTTETAAEVPEEITQETPAEATEALGDAAAPEEVQAEAEEVTGDHINGQAEEVPAEQVEPEATPEDAWGVDPAIAGSGAQPSWAKEPTPAAEPTPTIAPEPVTTYTGPPGFNTVASKAAVASQPRTSSRAGRFKNAEGQGVVLPASVSGVSAVEMQFGSLSFGGQGGDGVEAPVLEPETPAQSAPAPAQQITSPVRAPQPTAAVQAPHVPSSQSAPSAASAPSQPVAAAPSAQPQPSAPAPPSTHPYYSQQQQQQQPTQQGGYTAPHQTLQQQMSGAYASQFGQQPPQAQQAQDQSQQSFYRGQQDYYSAFGSQGQQQQQQPSQLQQHQQQPQQSHQTESASQQSQQLPSSQPQHHASPYDSGFGGFGAVAQPQHQPQQANDTFGAAQRAYDSYSASGYPRPPTEEPKQAAPAPSHTPTAPGQPQQGLAHQSQYYQQLNNMGYYQAAPYNPYYQYGQGPQPGFQQYYPLATRGGLYGQPNPQAPPAPIPQAKPSPAPTHAHSPYGGPSPYPSSNYDDQSSLNVGRYGEAKTQGTAQQPGAQAQTYQSQAGAGGLHNFLGMNTPSATSSTSRPQASTPDDGFKSQASTAATSTGASAGAPGQQSRATPQHNVNQQGASAAGQQHGFGYPYGGGAAGGYGNQDWSQYGGQHYGSRNGYSHWQQ